MFTETEEMTERFLSARGRTGEELSRGASCWVETMFRLLGLSRKVEGVNLL